MRSGVVVTAGIFLAGVLLAGTLYFLDDQRGSSQEDVPVAAEFSSKRLAWEYERQRDPVTGKIPDNIRYRERAYVSTLSPVRNNALAKSAADEPIVWQHRGPWNVGGRTRALAFDVTGEDTILAGGISGGLWRSENGGESWVRTSRPDQLIGVSALAQDTRPGKAHIWYYGTGEGGSSASKFSFFSLYVGDGAFKSTDNGRTWNKLAVTASGTPQSADPYDVIWRMATDPSNEQEEEVYAAVQGAIRRSSDGGETWTSVIRTSGFGATHSYYTDVAVTSTGVVYATLSGEGSKRGILRSDDGINFAQIIPEDFGAYRRVVIGIAPSNENVVYFLAETPGRGAIGKNFRGDSSWHSLWKYTYKSGDGTGEGGIWEDRSAHLPQYGGSFGDFYSQGSYDMLVKVKPDDENTVFIGGTNLYRSTDGFASNENTAWIGGYRNVMLSLEKNKVIEAYDYPKHHPDQHDVVFSPTDPNTLLVGSDGGIHKTIQCLADSIDWISLNNGYLASQFYTIAINREQAGDEMMVGGTQDNGTWRNNSPDSDAPWTYSSSGDGAYAAVANDGSYIVVSKQSGRIYRVDLDAQGAVTGSTRIDPAGFHSEDYMFINPFILDPNDSKTLFLPINNQIWVNRDITAVPLDNEATTSIGWAGIEAATSVQGVISALAMTTQNPSGRLWYGTNAGELYRMDDPLGDSPERVDVASQSFPGNGYVSGITVDPENGDRAIVVFSNYSVVSLFETTDAGETWHSISGNLEEFPNGAGAGPSCRSIAILHRGGRTLYLVGTSAGLFSTTRIDGDATIWTQEGGETIGNTVVEMIDARQTDGYVVLATHGNGVYSTKVGLLGVQDGKREIASSTLGDIRPLPLRDVGTVTWSLAEGRARHVTLELIDARGRSVVTVRDEVMTGGTYTDMLGASQLPAGLYFLRLEVDGASQMQKLTVLR